MALRWWITASAIALAFALLIPAGMLWMLRHPPQAGGSTKPGSLGLRHEERRLSTEDGVELDAWIVQARNETDSAVVVLHGYPASKADVLPAVAFLADEHHLVLLDHRGLGDSEGSTTLGIEEPLDVQAGVDAALGIEGVEHVGLLGFSMGAAAALQTVDHEAVDAVVAQAAYADLETLAPHTFGGLGPLAGPAGGLLLAYAGLIGLDADRARPIDDVGHTTTPILLVHGVEDRTIDPDHSRRLAQAAPTAKLWLVEDAHHGQAALHPDYEARVGGFLAEHLG